MEDKIKKIVNTSRAAKIVVFCLVWVYVALLAIACLLLRILPIKKNKVVFISHQGKVYGDNPRPIAEELKKQRPDWDVVWLMLPKQEADIMQGIRRSDYTVFNMLYELSTAKVWVNSNTIRTGILKRRGQYFIQTWHGGIALKKIMADAPDIKMLYQRVLIKYNAAITDLYVSNSDFCTRLYRRAGLYNGEIIECGSPRNDIFFKDNRSYVQKVKSYFNLKNVKIAMYAPTFRENRRTDVFNLDYSGLKKALGERFGGEWVILVRLHPENLRDAPNLIEYDDTVLNATNYDDMQELMAAADVLVTDYSSTMFEFAMMKKPCFLYAVDVEQYKIERDTYFKIEELPFVLSENNGQLGYAVKSYDEKRYFDKVEKFFNNDIGLKEYGTATEKIVERIILFAEAESV